MAEAQTAPKPGASRHLTGTRDIESVFRLLRDQRLPLSLRFDGHALTYTARVLDVQPAHFLLEDIRPRDGLRLLHSGASFTLTGRTDGLSVFADDLHVAEAAADRGVPYFLVALPNRLLYQQRRRAARFRLPVSVTAKGTFVRLERAQGLLEGVVIDVSVGGCRAAFPAPVTPPFTVDETIPCQIAIPNMLELQSEGAVRHHAFDKPTKRIVCGLEFVHMPIADRRRLEHFIRTIARLASAE